LCKIKAAYKIVFQFIRGAGKYELKFVRSSKMQHSPLKVVLCGRWKHCSLAIHRPGVCYCAVLSGVRKMSESKIHVSLEHGIIITFLMKEGCKPLKICSRLKKQYGEKTLSNVSAYKWSGVFKKERETVEN
jgi:hypothetical protein